MANLLRLRTAQRLACQPATKALCAFCLKVAATKALAKGREPMAVVHVSQDLLKGSGGQHQPLPLEPRGRLLPEREWKRRAKVISDRQCPL